MEAVAALGHVHDVFAMQRVFRAGIGHVSIAVVHPGLPGTQALMIVGESDLIISGLPKASFVHHLELASTRPGVVPGIGVPYVSRFRARFRGIANSVVFNGDSVVVNQLVLPGGIVSIGHGFQRRSQGSGGIGIPLLFQDVAAPVVFIRPGGARRAAGGVVFIVHPDQLAQGVVSIGGSFVILYNGSNIAHVVVGVGEAFPGLGQGGDQRGGVATAVVPGRIPVSRGKGMARRRHRPAAHAANGVVGIGHLVVRIAEGHERGFVLVVVGEIGLVRRAGGAHLFLKGFQVVVLVVFHLPRVQMRAFPFHVRDPHGSVGRIVLAHHPAIQNGVRQPHHLTVGTVLIGIRVAGLSVELYALEPFEIVIGIARFLGRTGAAVAVGHLLYGAVGIVHRSGQGLAAHLHRGGPSRAVKREIVLHVAGVVVRGIMRHLGQLILGIGIGIAVSLPPRRSIRAGGALEYIVLVVHRLSVGIGHAGQGARRQVNIAGHHLAPGVLLRRHIVLIGSVGGLGFNHHAAGTVLGLAGQGIAFVVVGGGGHNAQR